MHILTHVLPHLSPNGPVALVAAVHLNKSNALTPIQPSHPAFAMCTTAGTTHVVHMEPGLTVTECRFADCGKPLQAGGIVWALPPTACASNPLQRRDSPFYDTPWHSKHWNRAAMAAMDALYPGRAQCATLYHGTNARGCAGILETGAVRPAHTSHMCGKGVYMGPYRKALRFALWDHTHKQRDVAFDAQVVRCIVWLGEHVQVRGGGDAAYPWTTTHPRCPCDACAENKNERMKHMCDHVGAWMREEGGASALIYRPGPGLRTGKSGAMLLRTEEIVLHPFKTQHIPLDAGAPEMRETPEYGEHVKDWKHSLPRIHPCAVKLNHRALQAPLIPAPRITGTRGAWS